MSQTSSDQLDLVERARREVLEAGSWLMLAYSLGHEDACPCAECVWARGRIARNGALGRRETGRRVV